MGLELGGLGTEFAGKTLPLPRVSTVPSWRRPCLSLRLPGPFGVKGLYTYKHGNYKGHAYFGTGGTAAAEVAPYDNGNKVRVDSL